MEAIKRLELLTLWLTAKCYHQLSYIAIFCSFYSELQNWVDSLPTFNKSHLLGGLSSFTILSNIFISIPPKPKFCCLKSLYDKYLQIIFALVENVRIELLLRVPSSMCYHYTTFSKFFECFSCLLKEPFPFLAGTKKCFRLNARYCWSSSPVFLNIRLSIFLLLSKKWWDKIGFM